MGSLQSGRDNLIAGGGEIVDEESKGGGVLLAARRQGSVPADPAVQVIAALSMSSQVYSTSAFTVDIHIQDIRSAGWHLDAACLAALAAVILPLACLPSLALSVVVVDVTVVVVVDDCAFSRPDFPPRLPADYP